MHFFLDHHQACVDAFDVVHQLILDNTSESQAVGKSLRRTVTSGVGGKVAEEILLRF